MDTTEEGARTRQLLAELESRPDCTCTACGRPLCAHVYVVNFALGYKAAPRCIDCLAGHHEKPRAVFLDHVLGWVKARACYASGWRWADKEEGFDGQRPPPCLGDHGAAPAPAAGREAEPAPASSHAAEWDAGDLGCGDLILELRTRMRRLRAGEVLLLRATDPGAPTDLPAWCRLTGNRLAGEHHPRYWIEKGS